MTNPAAGPLLTVAVPTYNRSAKLAVLLESLAAQLARFPQVELLISDNASPDDTESVVQRFIAAGLRCRYIRNPRNLDADPNFLQCYQQAAGTYVWIVGDDDVILPGALARILPYFAAESVDIAFVDSFPFRERPNELGLARADPPVYRLRSPAALVHAVGLRSDFVLISSVIVNKHTVESAPHPDFSQGYNTQLLQLGWTFTALSRMRSALLFDRGLLAVCAVDARRGFDMARVFGVNWERMVRLFLGADRPLYKTLLNDQLYSWFVRHWYGSRRNPGMATLHDPVGQLRPLYGHLPLFWLCVYPLLTWPMFPAGCWLLLWRSIRRLDLAVNRLRLPRAIPPAA